jgi:hypothetical protein
MLGSVLQPSIVIFMVARRPVVGSGRYGRGLMSASPNRPAQPVAVIADGPGDLDRE